MVKLTECNNRQQVWCHISIRIMFGSNYPPLPKRKQKYQQFENNSWISDTKQMHIKRQKQTSGFPHFTAEKIPGPSKRFSANFSGVRQRLNICTAYETPILKFITVLSKQVLC